ncbi:GAF domain-containing protein [Sphaerisporangium album]|uniref:protein-serine/threonine phosphatase n=1 Tax=Sphaerisporangium album TaxID=509200 RepID=A0A367EXG5_9ACTN|nr:SpoIIE family protein phosphatase [Sphaerisporangium album]RCG22763.1 GAF domain-containing protein [Sphaerisporangium album]
MTHRGGLAALVLDENGCVTQWSGGAVRLFGRSAEKAIGHDICDLLLLGDRHKTIRHALDEVASGTCWSGVLSAECGDGRVHEVAFDLEPLTTPGPWGTVMVTAMDTRLPRLTRADFEAGERLALLNEVSTRIGATLDTRQAAEQFMDVAVPRLADTASVSVIEGLLRDEGYPDHATDGSVRVRRLAFRVDARYHTTDRDWKKAFPDNEIVVYDSGHPTTRCMETGTPISYGSAALGSDEVGRIGGVLGDSAADVLHGSSYLTAPLTARGTVLGFITLTRNRERAPFDLHDETLAADLAARAAICIDNARLYSREHRTTHAFQQNLAPSILTVPPGLELAHRYLPASAMTVGGDWYDVFPLSQNRIGLVIGDAMGHGAVAAGGMGQLRAAVRALTGFELTPDEVLRRLDHMADDMHSIQCATCLYAIIDLDTHTCSISRAGHPPPILVDPDGTARVLDLPSGLALGLGDPAFAGAFTTTRFAMPPGATLAFYTDGLVESREQDIDTGIANLTAALGKPHDTLDLTCATIIEALPRQYDDVALLLTRIPAEGG